MKNEKKVSNVSVESFVGWGKLKTDEQKTVMSESVNVFHNLEIAGKSKTAIGNSLSSIRDVLEPYRMFVGFVDHAFHMSRATAYRYIDQAKTLVESLPPKTAELAMIRGTKITPELIKDNPPPETDTLDDALVYLEKLEANPPRNTTVVTDVPTMIKEVLNFASTRRSRVQGDENKKDFDRKFIGMYLAKHGYKQQVVLNPIQVPDELIVKRGRPVKQAA